MAKQLLNTGVQPNDGSGDGLRTGGQKVNNNFNEIYSLLGDGENLLNTDIDFGPNKLLYSNQVDTVAGLSEINVNSYEGIVVHVENTGALYYAHAGRWHKLLSDNSSNNVTNYQDSLKSVAYSGDYNDLINKPSVPTGLTDLNIADGNAGQVLTTDGTGQFTFRDITASTIEFGNITGRPTTLAGYGIQDAFSGDYNDLENAPIIFSGDYNDLTNKPTIPTDISNLTDNTGALFDGTYSSLTGRPLIPADVNQLSDVSNLLFSGSYTDLSNKPTSFSSLTSLSMSFGVNVDEFSNDTTLGDASQTSLVTEFAVKSYVDTAVLTAGIALDDLGVVVNSTGAANLTYDSNTGIFSYTPPDLSSYATIASVPTALTDLGITDGTVGQVLTTNGAGTFSFQDPGDQIGNFTMAASVIDTDDSSAITITPAVVMSSDLTIENDLIVNGDIITTSTGTPEIFSDDNILLTAPNGVIISNDLAVGGAITTTGTINVGDVVVSNNITVSGTIIAGGDIIPDTNETYDLGTPANRFRDLYLSGSTINLGGTTISSQGGNFTVGQQVNTISAINGGTPQTFDFAMGPYTTGYVFSTFLDSGNLFEPGYAPLSITASTSGDNLTGITSLDDGGIYPFDGGGDNYFLLVQPADPQNELYVANANDPNIGVTFSTLESTLHPGGGTFTQTATHTAPNGETLSIQYTLSRDAFGIPQKTIDSVSQTGPFPSGYLYDSSGSNTWKVLDTDPTALEWAPVGGGNPGLPNTFIDFIVMDNIGQWAPFVSGAEIGVTVGQTTVPQGQTARTLQVSQIINLGTSTAPPVTPVTGDIALADGVLWDPVFTGKLTLVIYLGNTWVQIAVAP